MNSEVRILQADAYLEVVATAAVVDVRVMRSLLDVVAAAAKAYARTRVLLEVTAPHADVGVPELIDVWKHAAEKGLRQVRLAHLITGRPLVEVHVSFKEAYAYNRGMQVKTFARRDNALEWLLSEHQ